MIEVQNVTKAFKDVVAVDRLSLLCRPGEVLGLLGENGAGKTTTMRMMATILTPTSGDIVMDGYSVKTHPMEVRKRIGLLFGGDVELYARLTARENIQYIGKLHGLDQKLLDQRIEQVSKQLDMSEFLDRRVGPFSRGMRQKVAIARSLVHDPKVILFDEPTTGLDITAASVFRRLIKELQQQNKTILFSTHNMGEVEKLCSRVTIMHKGKMIVEGTISDLRKRYDLQDMDDIFMRAVGGEKENE
ncbi:ABC transporter ATP-binding protein [Brevibacillus sp. SKDU10]|uniref:ABC transporter ATP-binding protein n=1 Tax=Brevibacillus sp. SKDU10 TaxID=1247872 RepID=UPI0007C88204|nr:ATP-binding cassette domain-containing protein [Brevibacillus sp. SKDU10]OAJ74965.1 ABC transporter ATP-binding protein [Brevibacillus sp. SKDU10]